MLIENHKKFMLSLSNIPEKEWEYYISLLSKRKLKSGEAFCEIGDVVERVAFTGNGLFEAVYITTEGKSYIKKFYLSNSVMAPYKSLLNGSLSDVAIYSLVDCEVLTIPFKDIQSLYKRHTCWETIGRKFSEFEFVEREEREKSLLTLSPQQRYIKFLKDFQELEGVISEKKIASYLGITNVSLSRIKSKLKD